MKHSKFYQKALVMFLSLCLISNTTFAQNAWFNPQQSYYKFTVSESGIYRLNYENLKAYEEIIKNPAKIQIWLHGMQIPVRKVGIQDGTFDVGDYLEFYAKANDGSQDSVVYRPANARPPVNFNLFSDATALFLTVGTSEGLKMEERKYEENNLLSEAYHIENEVINYQSEWSFNNSIGLVPYLQHAYYERGECWTGAYILKDSVARKTMTLTGLVTNVSEPISFSALLNSRNYVNHQIESYINSRKIASNEFFGFDHFMVASQIQADELQNNSFVFSTKSPIKDALELYSWTNLNLSYPQKFDMFGKSSKIFNLKPSENVASLISIANISKPMWVYDISEPQNAKNIEGKLIDSQLKIYLTNRPKVSHLLVSSEIKTVANFQKIQLQNIDNQSDFLIITHTDLLSSAQQYAQYRASAAGGNHKVSVIDIQDIFNQFNFGEKSPIAIKNYLAYQVQNTNIKNRFLLLMGKGVSFPDVMKLWDDQNKIPTWGYPGSDNLFSSGLAGFDENTPAIPTGRLNVTTNQQVLNYLAKVKEYEAAEVAVWRKKILHLNGGQSKEEIQTFKTDLENLVGKVTNSLVNGEVESLSKQSDDPVVNVDISKQINEGVAMLSFIGHASPTTPDFNIGYASNASLNFKNKGKYPLMYFNGCGVGNTFYRYETLTSDWILTPDKGAIVTLANSFWSYTTSSNKYLEVLYQKLFNNAQFIGQSIGVVQQASLKELMAGVHNEFDISNAHQVILQGDPSIVIFPLQKPDYQISKESIKLQSNNLGNALGKADKFKIIGSVNNLGKVDSTQKLTVNITLTSAKQKKEVQIELSKILSKGNVFEVVMDAERDIQKIDVELDKANKIDELNEKNNITSIDINWSDAQYYNTYPQSVEADKLNPILLAYINDALPSEEMVFSVSPKISFRLEDENPLQLDTTLLEAYIKTPLSSSYQKIKSSLLNLTLQDRNTLIGNYLAPSQEGPYSLLLKGQDLHRNNAGEGLYLQWTISKALPNLEVKISPNPSDGFFRFEILTNVIQKQEAKLLIYNSLGKVFSDLSFNVSNGRNEYYLEKQSFAAGMYYYQVSIGEESRRGKIVIE